MNVEAQRSSDPNKLGYHLENRIIFYLARMISAQKQTEFYHSDYDSLKPVRSIWICLDSSKDGDSIEEINLDRKTIYGTKAGTYNMDLMRGIIIRVRMGDNIETNLKRMIKAGVIKDQIILCGYIEEILETEKICVRKYKSTGRHRLIKGKLVGSTMI